MKYKTWMSNGKGDIIEDIIEIDDNATEKEIEEACMESAFYEIDWGYEKIERKSGQSCGSCENYITKSGLNYWFCGLDGEEHPRNFWCESYDGDEE